MTRNPNATCKTCPYMETYEHPVESHPYYGDRPAFKTYTCTRFPGQPVDYRSGIAITHFRTELWHYCGEHPDFFLKEPTEEVQDDPQP